MFMDDGSNQDGGRIPPPPDESWWSAVLKGESEGSSEIEPTQKTTPSHAHCNQGKPEDWSWARDLYDCDQTVELPVIGYNRGGLLVEARDLRGFIPVSHLVDYKSTNDDVERYEHLATYVGERMALKVIEFDPERGRLVFSERAALAGPGKRTELLNELQAGQRVRGMVTNITRFGVFVDLGGVEGLIHVSELSWGRVRHPMDVVSCGEELEVQVLSVDREKCRVALSLKELLPDPWETVSEHYNVGEIVEGVVTNVVKFGAFVGVEEGLEGLIHISELGDGNLMHPRNVVDEGEDVRVRIINIDPGERRLGLSLRHVPQHDEEMTSPAYPEHTETF